MTFHPIPRGRPTESFVTPCLVPTTIHLDDVVLRLARAQPSIAHEKHPALEFEGLDPAPPKSLVRTVVKAKAVCPPLIKVEVAEIFPAQSQPRDYIDAVAGADVCLKKRNQMQNTTSRNEE